MAPSRQTTGMRGVYLVASELSKNGLIASPTSRSARGADILVTDQDCKKAWSVQVKTNAKTHAFWLINEKDKESVSPSHIYVFVNLINRKEGETFEFFVAPSKIVADRMSIGLSKTNTKWSSIYRDKIKEYRDMWELFR